MKRLSVKLVSAAPPSSIGSMQVFENLVQQSLERWAPQLNVSIVHLLQSSPKGPLDRLKAIGVARWRASRITADVVHILDSSHGYLIGNSKVRATPLSRTLTTVHDLIPALQAKGHFIEIKKPNWAAQKLIATSLKLIQDAGAVHTVSEATARDVSVFCGRKSVRVLANPLRSLPEAPSLQTSLAVEPFILHIGNQAFYKNRETVVHVFSRLVKVKPELSLVLAGAALDKQLSHLIESLDFSSNIHSIINPDDKALALLYQNAELLLFPSLYEGFGWPPLEAMHYGCPVVSSNGGALPEVCGNAALFAPPNDVSALSSACLRLINSKSERAQLISKGFRNLDRFSSQKLASGLAEMYYMLNANSSS